MRGGRAKKPIKLSGNEGGRCLTHLILTSPIDSTRERTRKDEKIEPCGRVQGGETIIDRITRLSSRARLFVRYCILQISCEHELYLLLSPSEMETIVDRAASGDEKGRTDRALCDEKKTMKAPESSVALLVPIFPTFAAMRTLHIAILNCKNHDLLHRVDDRRHSKQNGRKSSRANRMWRRQQRALLSAALGKGPRSTLACPILRVVPSERLPLQP
ncbi:hypothetical protein ALC57_05994 [Trachymyrmex cornetzi]|uniref:Uncharacterized protein n=1 Tax=Trachymyrmex cornetzi TaxID=471704 RepID=A0A151J975_9HYME|nr:hypothetical protein ALC57_05994 [Trachymyrmex cornetzi]